MIKMCRIKKRIIYKLISFALLVPVLVLALATIFSCSDLLRGSSEEDNDPDETVTDEFYRWTHTYGIQWADNAHDACILYDNGLMTSGYFSVFVDFDPENGHLYRSGSDDSAGMFVMRHNSEGELEWVETPDGPENDDTTMAMAFDPRTRPYLYVTGGFKDTVSFGSYEITSEGQRDIFVTKYSLYGGIVWLKTLGGTGEEESSDIVVDAAGNIYYMGRFGSEDLDFDVSEEGEHIVERQGGMDFFISKLDEYGGHVWTKTWDGVTSHSREGHYTCEIEGVEMAIGSDGSIYVAGVFRDTKDFDSDDGEHTLTATDSGSSWYPSIDIFALKLESDGSFAWARRWGTSAYEERGTSVALSSDESTVTIGGIYDYDHVFVYKLSSDDGTDVWTKHMDVGTHWEKRVVLRLNEQEELYVVSNFSGTDKDFDPSDSAEDLHSSAGGYDAFLTIFDSDEQYKTTYTFGGDYADIPSSFGIGTDGSVYIVGGFTSGNADFNPQSGEDLVDERSATSPGSEYDIFITKWIIP